MTTPRRGLTPEEIETFHREGYLVVPDVFPSEDCDGVAREVTDEITRRALRAVDEGKLSRTYEEYGFERQLARITEECEEVALSIWNGALYGPEIFRMITHPRVLDLAESLVGPEIIASSVYRLRPKVPNYAYGAVPWHQDSGYFDPFCDDKLVLTVWLPLVNATLETGCLHVIPRRHNEGIYRHQLDGHGWYLEIPPEELPKDAVVPCPVPKGGVLLMTNRTPHVSFDNTSDIIRWSMDLRYQSAATPSNAQFTRTDEERQAAGAPGAPLACYPPEPDFLVRSALRPHEVMADPEDFARMRREHKAPKFTDRWAARGAGKEVDWTHAADNVRQ